MSERAFALGGIMLGLKELYVIAMGNQEFEWQQPTYKGRGFSGGHRDAKVYRYCDDFEMLVIEVIEVIEVKGRQG